MLIIIEEEPIDPIVEGIFTIRELPQEWDTQATFLHYWARMKQAERARYTVFEQENLIVTSGNLAINTFLGSSGTVPGFAQYLALGNGIINGPAPADTKLVAETFRKVPALLTVVGNQSDITTYLASSDAVGAITEAGLYTGAATSTLNSGTIATHLVFAYMKTSIPVAVDYYLTRQ